MNTCSAFVCSYVMISTLGTERGGLMEADSCDVHEGEAGGRVQVSL